MIIDYELSGKIDSNNYNEVENNLNETINSYDEVEGIDFDATDLEYISSAGLKIILKCCKKYEHISVLNTQDYVYETLEMVGFDKIINVTKQQNKRR